MVRNNYQKNNLNEGLAHHPLSGGGTSVALMNGASPGLSRFGLVMISNKHLWRYVKSLLAFSNSQTLVHLRRQKTSFRLSQISTDKLLDNVI